MPSTSKKQHNFMAAVAHNPSFAKKAGVPSSVGKDFINADKGRTFAQGGQMEDKAMEKRHVAAMKKAGIKGKVLAEEKAEAGMKCGGKVKKYAKGGGVESKGKTKGKQVVMKKGGKC